MDLRPRALDGHSSPSAAALARAHRADMAEIRRLAEAAAGGRLSPRFTDAELMRHAISRGFLRAASERQRVHAIEHGAASAAAAAAWLDSHVFSSAEEVRAVGDLVWWEEGDGTEAPPTLHIALGAAVARCRTHHAALSFANVIVTQMEVALTERLGDGGGRPEQINVVMDVKGASTLSATRLAWVVKSVAQSLNRHYPGRCVCARARVRV